MSRAVCPIITDGWAAAAAAIARYGQTEAAGRARPLVRFRGTGPPGLRASDGTPSARARRAKVACRGWPARRNTLVNRTARIRI
jgi:hypothetical protein